MPASTRANPQRALALSSPEVCYRAFAKLIGNFSVDCKDELQLQRPFVSLAGIQQARCLWLWKAPCYVRMSEIAEWLHAETAWTKAKTLTIFTRSLDKSLTEVQGLLTSLKDVSCQALIDYNSFDVEL